MASVVINSNTPSFGSLMTQWNSLVNYYNPTYNTSTTVYQIESDLASSYADTFNGFSSGSFGQAISTSLPSGGSFGYIKTATATLDLYGSISSSGSTITKQSLSLANGTTIVASGSFIFSGLPYYTPLIIGSYFNSVSSSYPDPVNSSNTVIESISGASYYDGTQYSGTVTGFSQGYFDAADNKYLTLNLSTNQLLQYSSSGASVTDGPITGVVENVLNSSANVTDSISIGGIALDLAQTSTLTWSQQALAGNDIISLSGTGALNDLTNLPNIDSAMTSATIQASAAIVQTNLDALEAVAQQGKLGAIQITEPGIPTLTITSQQASADAAALAAIVTPHNTVIGNAAPCYVAGTLIAVPTGEVPVERLRVGDLVMTLADGTWVPRPVRWIGRFTVDLGRHPHPLGAAPVRIATGAIAAGVPHRDLLVSPDHAILLDGLLFHARALVNGATIRHEPPQGQVTYFHVELAGHAALLANGLAAESYLDTGNRGWFHAESGVRPLFPDMAAAPPYEAGAFAPLILSGEPLAAIHGRLWARAVDLGYGRTADPALSVLANGVALRAVPRSSLSWGVALPPGGAAVRLQSRTFVPSEADPMADDHRRLGIAVAAVRLHGRQLAPEAYREGWHAAESVWRWSDGDGTLALPIHEATTTLVIRAAAAGAEYWSTPDHRPSLPASSTRGRRAAG